MKLLENKNFSDEVLRVLEILQGKVTSCTHFMVDIHSIGLYKEI